MKKQTLFVAILSILISCINGNNEELPNWEEIAFESNLSKLLYEAYQNRNEPRKCDPSKNYR